METDNSSMTGFYINGKKVGSIAINGKSVWAQRLSVCYYNNLSTLISTVTVDFGEDAPDFYTSALEIEKKKFTGWDKNLSCVITDLSAYPTYKDMYDVTYKYASDNSVISVERYVHGDTVAYIANPIRKNYFISNFIPESSFDVSPISADLTVIVNDIKNTVSYSVISSYEHDAEQHQLQLLNVKSSPKETYVDIRYAEYDGTSIYNWSDICPARSCAGKTAICILLSGNDFEDQYDLVDLSIGDAKYCNVTYIFKLSDDASLSDVSVGTYNGHVIEPYDLSDLSDTISSTFIRWSYYGKIYEDTAICAEYMPRNFTIKYFNELSELIEVQTCKYGDKSVQPTKKIVKSGYKHICWKDANSNVISDSDFDFICKDISAYDFQKKICYLTLHKCYGNNDIVLSTCAMLSGDIIDISEFASSGILDIYDLDPAFKYISCIIDNSGKQISAYSNNLSLVYAANYYDFDTYRAAYSLKFNRSTSSFKMKLNEREYKTCVIESYDDLNATFRPSYVLKYADKSDNACIKFSQYDPNDNVCIEENESHTQYAYDNTKFHDKTLFILKYNVSNDTNALSARFQLNQNRAFTQVIENADQLKFVNKSNGSFFKIVKECQDDPSKFEYRTNNDSSWKMYDFTDIVESSSGNSLEYVEVRAFALNANLDRCHIETDFGSAHEIVQGKLQYLTSKYGEMLLPDSYYSAKIKNTANMNEDSKLMSASSSLKIQEKTASSKTASNKQKRKRQTRKSKQC